MQIQNLKLEIYKISYLVFYCNGICKLVIYETNYLNCLKEILITKTIYIREGFKNISIINEKETIHYNQIGLVN